MGKGMFSSLLGKADDELFVSVDIGTSAIKMMAMDISAEKSKLLGVGVVPTPANAINNNAVSKPDQIAEAIRSTIEANDIRATKATIALPGPAVFTKKITIAYSDPKELQTSIQFEAGNYIPHSIDAVHLDYQVLQVEGTSTMEVLLIAVKNEIIESYSQAVAQAGLEPAIADVDYFALENMFEINYPEEMSKTLALINIGARYSSVSILQDGTSLFTGDVGVGGRLYTDALCETLGMKPIEAEQAKTGIVVEGYDENLINETLDRTTEHVASELHRQLGFFWNAAATDKSIEAIFISGGASQASGLLDEIGGRTGMVCTKIDPFRTVDWSEGFDGEYVDEIKDLMGVSVGLASRRFGDKRHAFN